MMFDDFQLILPDIDETIRSIHTKEEKYYRFMVKPGLDISLIYKGNVQVLLNQLFGHF